MVIRVDLLIAALWCFFFNDSATTEIYTYGHTRSLHDALPICDGLFLVVQPGGTKSWMVRVQKHGNRRDFGLDRSEEHTSELQSLMRTSYAVFCLKKTTSIEQKHHSYYN